MRELATEFVEGREHLGASAVIEKRLVQLESSIEEVKAAIGAMGQPQFEPQLTLLRQDVANCIKLFLLNGRGFADSNFSEVEINQLLDKSFGTK